jgi:PAS domain S-box-containing protein
MIALPGSFTLADGAAALAVAGAVAAWTLLRRERRRRRTAERALAEQAAALQRTVDGHTRSSTKLAADVRGLQELLQEYMHQRESAEETLQASEERYRMLAESINDIVSLQELDGTAIYYSPSTERILGFAPSELIGRDTFSIMHPDDRDRIAGDVHLAAMRGETPLFEWRCLRKDGSSVWVETQTTLLRDRRGAPERLLSVSREIEKRRRAEEALRQSEERTRALISRAAYGIFRSTREGQFLEANPALVAMLGYDEVDELRRLDIERDIMVDPGEREDWISKLDAQQLPEWFDLRWRKKGGTPIEVRVSIQAVRDPYGQFLYFEGFVEDVTERHRREAVLRRNERMASLGRTLAGAAHELNNPLAAVSGYAQILLKTPISGEERAALETIHREAKRAARIVKDLLTFARPQDAPQREPVDLNGIARYIVETQRYAIETRGIVPVLELSATPAMVLADAAQLEQVVLNLLVNARQALEERLAERAADPARAAYRQEWTPTLRVRTALTATTAVLDVTDNGPGIAAADLPRIWDPFFTTKPEGMGTGLGLSVVHGIIEAHDGTIDVESTAGEGTRFAISLPRAMRDDDASIAKTEDSTATGAGVAEQPLDILVVDDETVILNLLSRYFTMRGHAVIAAQDGRQALRIAEQASFDVVICDLRMPGLDGYEVIRRLQTLPTCDRARFILSTGDTISPPPREAHLQIAAVVAKPYEVETLRRIVEGVAPMDRAGTR